MGVKGLFGFIKRNAPKSIKETVLNSYFGRKIAIDATTAIYQFLIAIRREGAVLTDETGKVTSHLIGIFYRSIRLIENGIKPIWIFDGEPPEEKAEEIKKRKLAKEEALEKSKIAMLEGDFEAAVKFKKRNVSITPEIIEESITLIKLLGMPVIIAPSEAESTCVSLVKQGKAWAVASEDMDCLPLGAPILLKGVTGKLNTPIQEIHLVDVLEGLELEMNQFIDFCILLGVDYSDRIKGIGPLRAFKLIKEFHNIEPAISSLNKEKYPLPEKWKPIKARKLFNSPEIATNLPKLEWKSPDMEGIIKLLENRSFDKDRIINGLEKLKKFINGPKQTRLDSFFIMRKRKTRINPPKSRI